MSLAELMPYEGDACGFCFISQGSSQAIRTCHVMTEEHFLRKGAVAKAY
jgi:hypothetical protein